MSVHLALFFVVVNYLSVVSLCKKWTSALVKTVNICKSKIVMLLIIKTSANRLIVAVDSSIILLWTNEQLFCLIVHH